MSQVPTPRQLDVLVMVHAFRTTKGFSPTIREIGRALGIASTNGVNDHIKALEKKGLVVREGMSARTLRLTDEGRRAFTNLVSEAAR